MTSADIPTTIPGMSDEDATDVTETPLVSVRATAHLRLYDEDGRPAQVAPGQVGLADPSDPYIAGLIDAELLVPEGADGDALGDSAETAGDEA